jgi:D-serine deaminase-like pyridoxal phosphate-dependent protein
LAVDQQLALIGPDLETAKAAVNGHRSVTCAECSRRAAVSERLRSVSGRSRTEEGVPADSEVIATHRPEGALMNRLQATARRVIATAAAAATSLALLSTVAGLADPGQATVPIAAMQVAR